MQQDNIIQQHLRNIDDQQEPDLRHQDAHWQQMAQMLGAPAVVPQKKPAIIRYLIWGLGSVLILVALLKWTGTGSTASTSNNKIEPPTNEPTANVSPNTAKQVLPAVPDSGKSISPSIPNDQESIQYAAFTDDELLNAAVAEDLRALKINYTPCASCPVNVQDSTKKIPSPQQQLQWFFARMAKPATAFLVNNQRDTVLTAPEGTQLEIPAGSLDSLENVLIEIREFYRNSEIILNQLHSRSNKAQLITAGMLNITAMSDGKYIDVKNGQQLRLIMTGTPEEMEQMQLFRGETNSVTVSQGESESGGENFTSTNELLNWIPQPDTFKAVGNNKDTVGQRKAYAYFRSGQGGNDWMVGQPPVSQKKPADLGLKPQQLGYQRDLITQAKSIRRRYGLKEVSIMIDDTSDSKLEEKFGVNLSHLGWINCDRFYNDPRPKINYEVRLPGPASHYYAVLLFDNIRSIMPARPNGNKLVVDEIPLGEPVTVVCIGINKEGRKVCAIAKAVTSLEGLADLHFEPVTETTLKSSLSKMDR